MSEQTVYLTREGYERLQSELDYLRKVRRQEVARRLHDALAEGDLLENAELEAARNEQAFVEGRILELERMLGSAEIIEAAQSGEVVSLGSRVTIVEDNYPPETYHIIDSAEADPSEGRISFKSPLGRALMGRRVGDEVRVNAPDGVIVFHVVEIH